MNASFVLDSSVTLAWCFPDEGSPATRQLLERMDHAVAMVPSWWYLEVTNVLALAERRNRITPVQTGEFIHLIETLDLEVDEQIHRRAHLLPLCRSHGLTSYDAAYLELAVRHQLPLATLDEALSQATRTLGLNVLGK